MSKLISWYHNLRAGGHREENAVNYPPRLHKQIKTDAQKQALKSLRDKFWFPNGDSEPNKILFLLTLLMFRFQSFVLHNSKTKNTKMKLSNQSKYISTISV